MKIRSVLMSGLLLAGALVLSRQLLADELSTTPVPAATAQASNCGWLPHDEPRPGVIYFRRFIKEELGCGVAPSGPEAWHSVARVETAALELAPERTVLQVVFLDEQKRRVLPVGQELHYEMRFKKKVKGKARLEESAQRDGVFTLELPANAKAEPCHSNLILRFQNGTEWVERSFDPDVELSC